VVAVKFALDTALTVLTLVLLAFELTGLVVHEWLGVVLIAAVVAHLLFSWSWIIAAVRRFFAGLATVVRVNAVLNLLLFITTTLVIGSG